MQAVPIWEAAAQDHAGKASTRLWETPIEEAARKGTAQPQKYMCA